MLRKTAMPALKWPPLGFFAECGRELIRIHEPGRPASAAFQWPGTAGGHTTREAARPVWKAPAALRRLP